jgi:hypothetical protein
MEAYKQQLSTVTPSDVMKKTAWVMERATITLDTRDDYGYVFQAEFKGKLPYPMISAIKAFIKENATGSSDSKSGMSYGYRFYINDETETEMFIGVSGKGELHFTHTSK